MKRPSLAAWILILWGAALCFVPLLHLLAFEFALFTTVPVTFVAAGRGMRAADRPGIRSHARPLGRLLGLTALPLVPITLNALRIQNCNLVEGFLFYLLLPGLTAPIAYLWGYACARWRPRRPRRVFALVFAASFAAPVGFLVFAPPVDAFHWFLGYYPGSLYDEVIPLTGRLVGARVIDLAFAFAAALAVAGGRDARLVAAGIAGAGLAAGLPLDLFRTADHVQSELGGFVETPEIRLHHPAGLPGEHVAALMTELAFRHGELATFFGRRPEAPIDVWFYADGRQKKRLMGAGAVRIAKPWQRAVHLQVPDVGDGILAHELAHAFSAEISAAPHHLSLTPFLVPNMGLIEGVAVAAAWDDSPLDAHQWTLAMHRLGVARPLRTLLSPQGFLTANSRVAYTQCGSYLRWLRDTDGPEAVEALYRRGHLEAPADGSPDPVDAWLAFLETRTVSAAALATARLRFDRPAIFGKTCAHEIAALRARLEEIPGHDVEAGLAVVEAILSHLPDDPDAQLTRIAWLARRATGGPTDEQAALDAADALAARPDIGLVRRARAREWQADLRARRGRPDDLAIARALYDALDDAHFDRAWTRRIAVKRAAVDGGAWGRDVIALLTRPDEAGPDSGDALLERIVAAAPDHPLTHYLRGRRFIQRGDTVAGLLHTQAALDAGLPHRTLTFEALRLVAATRFQRGAYTDAAAAYAHLTARMDLEIEAGERAVLETWSRRSHFFAAHPPEASPD
jgi:hypothetical protein